MIRWKIAQFAELKWWRNYLKKKNPQAYLQWKKSYWRDFLDKCGIYPELGMICLDAGCGPAGIFIILDEQHIDALDPLIDKYNTELEVFRKAHYPNVHFISSPIEAYNFEKLYDIIFCLNAINHVADWTKSIDRLMSLLKPGGTMILSTDVHRHTILKSIFRLLPGDILHPQQHSLKDYLQAIEKHKPESVETVLVKRQAIFDYYAIVIKK